MSVINRLTQVGLSVLGGSRIIPDVPPVLCMSTLEELISIAESVSARSCDGQYTIREWEILGEDWFNVGKKPVSSTVYSTTFEATREDSEGDGRPTDFFVRYVSSCHDVWLVDDATGGVRLGDPIVREFSLMSALAKLLPVVVSPPLSISDPRPWLISGSSDRYRFKMNKQMYDLCSSSESYVRSIISPRTGQTVSSYMERVWVENIHRDHPDDARYIRLVVYMARRLFKLLQSIHDLGVVHGGVSEETIRFRTRVESYHDITNSRLTFLNFEDSALVCGPNSEQYRSDSLIATVIGEHTSEYASPWELEGGVKGFRDDAFRALELVTEWLSVGALNAARRTVFHKAVNPRRSLKFFKDRISYFAATDQKITNRMVYNVFEIYTLPIALKLVISRSFLEIENHIRSLPSPLTPVDFNLLENAFDRVILAFGHDGSSSSSKSVSTTTKIDVNFDEDP